MGGMWSDIQGQKRAQGLQTYMWPVSVSRECVWRVEVSVIELCVSNILCPCENCKYVIWKGCTFLKNIRD